MKGRNRRLFVLPALALLLAGALTLEASAANETGSSEYRDLFKNAFQTQTMPDRYLCPYVPEIPGAPRAPYDSVTQTNLQGRWVNRYKENNGTVDVVDILSVNGDTGRIECYKNGERYVVWNNDGGLYIEDRKDRGVCPEVSLMEYVEDAAEGNYWIQYCGIYIRRVDGSTFYDGGSLVNWNREEPEDLWSQYLYNTVTLENLQGVWYSEYEDSAGFYQDILNVEGNLASLFETVSDRTSETWNSAGHCMIAMAESSAGRHIPELVIRKEVGPAAGGTAGIYISRVDADRFYDAGLNRWFVRVPPESEYNDGESAWEGNYGFTIYGGNAEKTEKGYVLSPAEEEGRKLVLDAATQLVHPEQLDGYKEGFNAVQWADSMMSQEYGTGLAGVYDTDVTGDHIDRIYGLYWWD